MVSTDVYDLRWRVAGLTYAAAAEVCGIHPRTIKRWEASGLCPVWFVTLCRARGGEVSALHGSGPEWAGWRLAANSLVSPEGITYSPYEINSLPWLWAMVADLRRELREQTGPGTQRVLPFPDLALNKKAR